MKTPTPTKGAGHTWQSRWKEELQWQKDEGSFLALLQARSLNQKLFLLDFFKTEALERVSTGENESEGQVKCYLAEIFFCSILSKRSLSAFIIIPCR